MDIAEQRLYLGYGAFLRAVTASIAHPLAVKDEPVGGNYFRLLHSTEKRIFAALAIHCGKINVAKQMMSDELHCALKDDVASGSRDCMLGFVPELMTEHIKYLYQLMDGLTVNKPMRNGSCQCAATMEALV